MVKDFAMSRHLAVFWVRALLDKCSCGELSGGKVDASAADISQVSLNDSVRVATVDNFQGEESTIVILSLVRNNK